MSFLYKCKICVIAAIPRFFKTSTQNNGYFPLGNLLALRRQLHQEYNTIASLFQQVRLLWLRYRVQGFQPLFHGEARIHKMPLGVLRDAEKK